MYLFYALCIFLAINVVYSDILEECKKAECPQYEVVEKKENYEIRKYPAYKVVETTSKGKTFVSLRKKNFFKLYRFQQGNNDKHHSFPMVYPFVTIVNIETWKSGDKKKEVVVKDEFSMAFFIPKGLHDNPPQPLTETDEVSVKEMPERLVYAVSFPGHANSKKVFELQKKLHGDLEADGVAFDHSSFYVAEYNKINQLWGRHNDVAYSA